MSYGYRACPACGVAVQRKALADDTHECDTERFINHQVMLWKKEIEHVEEALAEYLATPWGGYHLHMARRT